ncbi:SAM-dependent methyltransferase [Bacillus marinisedimentorum]|uniref:SAM-dependent methyltransferase n=1 Tax=Bacillus marinisedimentorum TaxID=1821260 RepID=UPI000872AC5F|nr:SAM-dependent methyltransferase [Bacillus marinisedimentorum]
MNEQLKKLFMENRGRPVSYADFMETALYDPDLGYYSNPAVKVGKTGDFYTSPSIHQVFGAMFASVFINVIESHGIAPRIAEFGGGTGTFAGAVLNAWKEKAPETFNELEYIVIERSQYHRNMIKERMGVDKVKVFSTLEEAKRHFPAFEGIVFSNELLDAFPVDVVKQTEEGLQEVRLICGSSGDLAETLVPATAVYSKWIDKYHRLPLTAGQRIEIPLHMEKWITDISAWLSRGYVFTVDYGYTAEEWQHPARKDGSLRGYKEHMLIPKPYENPGAMDITSHVHWDAFAAIGREQGLELLKRMKQRDFLLEAGILKELQENYDPNPFSEKSRQNRAIRSFLMDGDISSSFDVYIQGKGLVEGERDIFPAGS